MNAISDLEFFIRLVKQGSLSALAREIGVTPPAVSKKLLLLEKRLGVRLLTRTTRRIAMTQEGEIYLATGSQLLEQIQEMERTVSSSRDVPRGLLKVNATFGFGRRYIAPAISAFRRRYPEVEVQLDLTDRPMNLAESAFDVGIRFGTLPDQRMIARMLISNQRWVCASPDYLARAGIPALPSDLRQHACLVLRENDSAYGTWHFTKGRRQETVKVHGVLSSNDGEATLNWALEGEGILVRSKWDVQSFIDRGRLARVLEDWTLPNADIYAIFPQRLHLSAKVRVFIDFLQNHLTQTIETP
jgi:LysR family transcriptional regulator, transcriptional activator for dmlA